MKAIEEGDCTRLIPMRLLNTAGRRCGLAGGLGCKLLTGRLATGGFTYADDALVMCI